MMSATASKKKCCKKSQNFMDMIIDMVNQNIQEALKKLASVCCP
jgi:F0F1-type ATP synthase membrane subunit a